MFAKNFRQVRILVLMALVLGFPAYQSWAKGISSSFGPAVLAEAGAEEGATEGEHEESQGKQSPIVWATDLALWTLVSFLVFLFVLKKFAWGPLIEGLDKRESRIRKDLADAETARVRSEQMMAEHAEKLEKVQDEVREILAEARRDADALKQEIVSQAQKEAEATRRRSIEDINRARDQALKDLFDQMTGQVTEAVESVLGRSVSDADQDRLIDEALSQFSGRSSG